MKFLSFIYPYKWMFVFWAVVIGLIPPALFSYSYYHIMFYVIMLPLSFLNIMAQSKVDKYEDRYSMSNHKSPAK